MLACCVNSSGRRPRSVDITEFDVMRGGNVYEHGGSDSVALIAAVCRSDREPLTRSRFAMEKHRKCNRPVPTSLP
jgi:hypothetical protein